MSWWDWKGRLLPYAVRYGLLKSGFLDEDTAKDLANFDVSLGSTRSAIELRNVGLNVERIRQVAQLPPAIRLEVARISTLRLCFVRDGYQPNIELELDGVEVVVRLEDDAVTQTTARSSRSTSPEASHTPQHRKVHRRIRSPPPYDPGGQVSAGERVHLPTTQEMARSFLLHESPQERKEMEASMAADTNLEESMVSDFGEDGELGTGVTGGLPAVLSGMLEGVLERAKYKMTELRVRVETHVDTPAAERAPVALEFRVGHAEGEGLRKAAVSLHDLSLDLLTDEGPLEEFADLSRHPSPAVSRAPTHKSFHSELDAASDAVSDASSRPDSTLLPFRSRGSNPLALRRPAARPATLPVPARSPSPLANKDESTDTTNDSPSVVTDDVNDIQPGDDNITWASRRSQSTPSVQDLWNSMLSDDAGDDSFYSDGNPAFPRSRPVSRDQAHSDELLSRRQTTVVGHNANPVRSWPVLDAPSGYERQPSPGSWPRLEEGSHSAAETQAPLELTGFDSGSPVLEADSPEDSPPGTNAEQYPDMTESRLFTHEEAESIYMSAVMGSTHDSPRQARTAEDDLDIGEPVVQTIEPVTAPTSSLPPARNKLEPSHSANATPRAQSPEPSSRSPATKAVARQLLFVDKIDIVFKSTAPADQQSPMPQPSQTQSTRRQPHQTANMPGAFSIYSDLSRSRNIAASMDMTESIALQPAQPPLQAAEIESSLGVNVGLVMVRLDFSTGRMLYYAASRVVASLTTPAESKEPSPAPASDRGPPPRLKLQMASFDALLIERLTTIKDASPDKPLIGLACEKIVVEHQHDLSLSIKAAALKLGQQELLALRHDYGSMTNSRIFRPDDPVLSLAVTYHVITASKQTVTNVSLETASLHLMVDLANIDDTFSTYGGLSGMLEIGGSVLMDSTANSAASPSKSTKGVRFVEEEGPLESTSQLKFNGRINGVSAELRANRCTLALRSTALKIVHRPYGTSLSLNQLILNGPHDETDATPPLVIDLATVRLEYLLSPQDKDLERLLSLLTPSRDKYDSDEDILIDTLLRQRRKGAILRLRVDDLKVRLDTLDCVASFASLGDDLAKLSVVTDYLPEDERPGMLALVCVKSGEVQVPVNDSFGFMKLAVQDVHVAHVGLPALLALSVGGARAHQVGGPDLVRSLVPLSGAENTPVIMARMLGDEEVPTVKIKLFNLCVEYSVPILMLLLETDKESNASGPSTGHDGGASQEPRGPVSRSSSNTSSVSSKKLTIHLLVHDSGIGLSPRTLPSKAFFVLSDARVSVTLPTSSQSDVVVDLRRAVIFLTDAVTDADVPHRSTKPSSTNPIRVHAYLQQIGFVSIGSIMSARVNVHENEAEEAGDKATEVDFRVELFLLETCADSTATLFATLGDLAPPGAPSREAKYLTQPMTIEDMMASFTGETVEEPEVSPETLFDVDDDITIGSDLLDDIPHFGSDDRDLFEESEMTASLYGPVSGILGDDGDFPADPDADQAFSETVASLLDEDPFEMAELPGDVMTDAALLRALDKQRQPVTRDGAVLLPEAEYEDLGMEALGATSHTLGQGHRFNAPVAGRRVRAKQMQENVPFRLRVRDSHIIWHLHDGYDWQRTRDGIAQTVEAVEKKAEERKARRRHSHAEPDEEESVIGDFLFNSIYIGVATGHEAQDLRRAINHNIDDQVSETESVPASALSRPTSFSAGGHPIRDPRRRRLKLGRSKSHKIAFELKGVAADVLVLGPGTGDVSNTVNLRIKDFEIFDRVPTSSWRKFLTYASDGGQSRELSRPMFDIDVSNIKTLASHSASEMVIHVSTLPLRLHVDQDALDFISRFFEFKDPSFGDRGPPSEEPFIQRLEVETVQLCLDYKPKQVDYVGLRSGRASELKNFVTLDGANITLKHVIVYGLRGFETIHPTLNDIWVQDVLRTQLPTVVAGVAAMRSLATLGVGVRDVVAIPVREYRKDGRVVRGIQKGAYQFGKTTASELARLGAKVALGTQTALASAEQYLGPGSSSSSSRGADTDVGGYDDDESEQKAVSAYANQPLGVLAGLKTARRQLEHDLLTARDALIAVQGEMLDSRTPGAAAAAVVRHAPTLLLRPVIGATRALGTTLLGVGNQIDRSNLRKIEDVSGNVFFLLLRDVDCGEADDCGGQKYKPR